VLGFTPTLGQSGVATLGVIEKDIAHMDKMQENDLASTFEDQQSNVNAWC